ncbi:MAG: hypothetical protein IKK53_05330 [Ruminiclostridium sp.]|nr:hypothetical protein [Ruminiclostridium sp.]
MRITRTLSILSIIICVIYIVGGLLIMGFPAESCFAFGLGRYMTLDPDYAAHAVGNPVITPETVDTSSVYFINSITAIIFCLVPVIAGAVLTFFRKTGSFSAFLAVNAVPCIYVTEFFGMLIGSMTFMETDYDRTNYYLYSAICRFWSVIALCGVTLCIISTVYEKLKIDVRKLSVISISGLAVFIVISFMSSGTEFFITFTVPLILSACLLIIINILSIKKATGRKTAIAAVVIAASFPVALNLFHMILCGDYFGFMYNRGKGSMDEIYMFLWYINSGFTAAASLKGADNERLE